MPASGRARSAFESRPLRRFERKVPGVTARRIILFSAAILSAVLLTSAADPAGPKPAPDAAAPPQRDKGTGLLELLGITPSPESRDYVRNKTQFQLHTLLTEQRHPKTWNLSERIEHDTLGGLRMLSGVDDDIRAKLGALAAGTTALDQAGVAVDKAILEQRKICIYGCGATGRLAKQMESAFWRPFWRKVRADARISRS